MEKIALLPGGFKPPHAGHYNMAIWLAENTDANRVIVKVGAKERDGITREISLQLWDLFLKNDPNSNSQKITVLASNSNSPVQDVYDFVENEAPGESTIYLGMGEKDINDARFKNIPKFAEPRGIKFETTLVPPQAGGVSGTKMREFIKNNDKESFQQYIPEFLTDEQKDRAWELVSSLNEDFYDPRNKFYDFAKSNDPGPKDDIEPSYKYKRGGIYGRMYEIEQEIEELMYGTMNNQEKAKHAKNLKRLKKDLTKQGDQYIEVPDYLIGTLTRKLYESGYTKEDIKEIIKKIDGKYVVYPKRGGKRLGTHTTKKAAEDQLTAIHLNKERKLTKGELEDRERIAKDLPDKEFKKRYGKDWKAVKIATATKMAKNEGDTYEKMAAKGKKKGNLKQGTVRKRLKIKDGEKIPLSLINKEISRIKKMDNPSEKNKKYLKALNLAKTLKTTTNVNEADPKVGTGKKPKGSGRRLYTDEDPTDTIKVKFSTRQDIVDTLNKKSFKIKSHARQSQVINLIHQRVRAALNRAKDPDVKKRLKTAFDYIKKRKEASKKKTQRMKKEGTFTKAWWKEIINEVLLTEGGAAGHMAHPFDLPNVKTGRDLKTIFEKAANSLDKNPGSVKIDGVNSSIRLVDIDGKKQFVMDRGSKKELDIKGITKDDLLARFGEGHGMIKVGGEVLDMFNEALPKIENDLKKLGAWDDPNILFNMEYVSGKTNVQDYGSNFIAIHGLNKIKMEEVQGKRGPLVKRSSSEISYDKNALQSLLNNLKPIAKKRNFEVYGSVPTEMNKKPNFSSALSKNYSVESSEGTETKSLSQWLDTVKSIPKDDFIFMNVGYKEGSSTINRKKVGAVSKQVYLAILNGENVDDLFDNEADKEKAIDGFVTYLATEKLGDEVLKVLDSPMGSVENHEGVVIRDESIAKVPFKITGKFILGGMASDF